MRGVAWQEDFGVRGTPVLLCGKGEDGETDHLGFFRRVQAAGSAECCRCLLCRVPEQNANHDAYNNSDSKYAITLCDSSKHIREVMVKPISIETPDLHVVLTTTSGHQGCVNAIAWNAKGSLLISGSDDTRGLLHSIETGQNANIFSTKFVPDISDELAVSGAGDAEVRIFSLSHSSSRSAEAPLEPVASYKCHTMKVKKLAIYDVYVIVEGDTSQDMMEGKQTE
ncbi:hypothetical protein ZIOFF_061121 [Zingiber officinale]|uniref:Uncharacterized protein n=1 Tax=Zingiber officinale TaxID=94328 RepID=A0A8J5FBL4_ZINOF|nr:hypothetical protein ZIOFF_061121 [Zingiber officinale]